MAKRTVKGKSSTASRVSVKNNSKKIWAARFIVTIILVGGLLLSLIWADAINRKFNLIKITETDFSGQNLEEVFDDSSQVVGIGKNLNVHFIDVGQGDSCIIELPDDRKMIIDGGDSGADDEILTYIDKNIREADGKKIESFDYAVLTHSDEDHSGSLDNVLLEYPAEVFYRPNILCGYNKNGFSDPGAGKLKNPKNHDTLTYSKVLTAGYNLDKKNGITTQVIVTDARNEETSKITPALPKTDPNYYEIIFYAPLSDYYSDVNDYSPVIILEYQGKRIALSGDAEKEAEERFVAETKKGEGKYSVFDENYTVNVIKLDHHGSRTSSSVDYLETLTTPDTTDDVIIIISCALVNSYGHPHPEVLTRLKQMGFKQENFLSTATNSSLGLSVRGEETAGQASYNLYFGADMVRFEEPTISLGVVDLQWNEMVYTLIFLIVLTVILVPLMKTIQKAYYKAKRKAKR